MSLRFARPTPRREEGQEDAYTCFQQMRALFDTGTEGAPMLRNLANGVSILRIPVQPRQPHIRTYSGGRRTIAEQQRIGPARRDDMNSSALARGFLGRPPSGRPVHQPLRARCLKRGLLVDASSAPRQ